MTGRWWLIKLARIDQYEISNHWNVSIYRLFRVEFGNGKTMLHLKQGQDIVFVSNQVTDIIALAILATQIITSELRMKDIWLERMHLCKLPLKYSKMSSVN